MSKYLVIHTLPPGGVTRDDVQQVTQAAQNDPVIRGLRSFLNLTEGKGACIMEAPDAKAVGNWFTNMKVPFDSITEVEIEGERGTLL